MSTANNDSANKECRLNIYLYRRNICTTYNKDIVILLYRYDNSPDFTVVLQPFIKLFNAPNADPNHAPPIDSTLVTYDCFHFSQKGHALGKKQLIFIVVIYLNVCSDLKLT